MNNVTYKEIRQRILEILYRDVLKWTSDALILEMLQKAEYIISLPEIQGNLRYLEEIGFIEQKQAEVDEIGLARNLAKLTWKGWDFIEGNGPDEPGISRCMSSVFSVYPEIRGWILRILYTNLPEYTGDHLISQLLDQGSYKVSPSSVQLHLNYLSLKKYVDIKEATLGEIGLARHLAKLTVRGVDFAEGNHPEEPGVVRR